MSQRLEHSGNAAATTLVGALSAGVTTFDVADATGWPTGAVGPFVVTIDAETADEERILCLSRTGTTITVDPAGRGWEGTTDQNHDPGAAVAHTFSATEADEANRVVVEVDAVSGALVGTTATQTLTGKTIDLTDNTVVTSLAELSAAVSDDDVVGVAATQTLSGKTIDLTDNTVNGTLAEFSAAVSDDDVVGVAATQTLTGKTLTSPQIDTPTGDVARGVLGYAEITADSAAAGAVTADVAGLSAAVTVGAGRRVRVTAVVNCAQGGGIGGLSEVAIREGSTTLALAFHSTVSGDYRNYTCQAVLDAPSSGAHTYKVSLRTSGGTLNVVAGATYPSSILVEDIGDA